MVGAVGAGAVLAGTTFWLTLVWYRAQCFGPHAAPLCTMLNRSPPWVLLTGIAAAPAVLLTWYWRTTHKNTDINQKHHELDLAEREHTRQLEEEKARAAEVQEQVALQKMQLDQARTQQSELARARDVEFKAQQRSTSLANETARETHLLDVYLRGIDALTSTEPQRQTAGVALVAQVGRESEKYRSAAIQTLAGYIRSLVRKPQLLLPPVPGMGKPVTADDNARAVTALKALATLSKTESDAVDLSGLELRDVELTGGDLRFVVFARGNLAELHFLGTDLRNADFSSCKVGTLRFINCDCRDVRFSFSEIEILDHAGCQFQGARFSDAKVDLYNIGSDSAFKGAAYTKETLLKESGDPANPAELGMELEDY